MGCSYDPVPYDYVPSPEEQWLKDNYFSKHDEFGSWRGGSTITLYSCSCCGTVLLRGSENHFLKAHMRTCPSSPRHEVPKRSVDELNDAKFRETRYH